MSGTRSSDRSGEAAPAVSREVPARPEGESETILEVRGLEREFGAVRALDGVDLRLRSGELLAVFGPNGAGKTSLLRVLGGDLRPTRGSVLVRGEPRRWGDPDWRARVGVLSHLGFLYGHLTAEENLRFYGRLYGLDDLPRRVPERLREVGLEGAGSRRVREFSRGMHQRLAVARTLLHDPDLVLLDEPYTGLDPHAAGLLGDILRGLRDERRTVVLVTHHLRAGLELADRVAVLVRGRIVLEEAVLPAVDVEAFGARYRRAVESPE